MSTTTAPPQTAKQLERKVQMLQEKITKRSSELADWREQLKGFKVQLTEARKVEKEKKEAKAQGNGQPRAAPKAKAKQDEEEE